MVEGRRNGTLGEWTEAFLSQKGATIGGDRRNGVVVRGTGRGQVCLTTYHTKLMYNQVTAEREREREGEGGRASK